MNNNEWIKKLQIPKEALIKQAMKQMDTAALKILFVVDKESKFIGTVTDGDFRRWFLSGKGLEGTIEKLFNTNPTTMPEDYILEDVKRFMLEKRLECIPILDRERRIVDALFWKNIFQDKYKKMPGKIDVPVVIMAGGRGSRLDPFTKVLPKPLIPFGSKPIIEVIIDRFIEYGAKDFHLTLNYKGEMVKVYFESIDKNCKINYVWEKDFYGTAGGIKILPENLGDRFIVSNCDILVDLDYNELLSFHDKNNNILTVVGSLQHHIIPYGVIYFENGGKINKIEEKPEINFTINTGLYVFSKKAIDFIPENKYFDMTDLVNTLLKDNEKVGVFPVSQKSYIDIGHWEEYAKNSDNLTFK